MLQSNRAVPIPNKMLQLHVEIEIDEGALGSAHRGSATPAQAGKMRIGSVALPAALKRHAESF